MEKKGSVKKSKTTPKMSLSSKVEKMKDDALKKKVQKIENKGKNKKEKKEININKKARSIIFNTLVILNIVIVILIILSATVIDTKEIFKNIEYSSNINLLNRKLQKLIKEKSKEEGFNISSLDSKILAYDTDGFYITLVDELYDYKNEYTKSSIAILDGKLVYMGNDEKFRIISEKKSIPLDYTILNNMYMDVADFEFDEDTGTIKEYYGDYEIVVIPEKINDVEVKNIGQYAFDDKNISIVILPETINGIGYGAFANNKIYYINFPDSLESISPYAFYKNKLTSVKIGENVKQVGDFAFASNEITSIDIKSQNTMYGDGCFNQNYLSEDNAYIYNSYNGNDKYEIVSYGGNSKSITNIPEGVIKIGESAFLKFDLGINKYNKITSVNLPSSLKIVGNSAFKNNSISSINIPGNVEFIGMAAFKNNNISNLKIENRDNIFFGVECFNNNNISGDDAYIITQKVVSKDLFNVDYNGVTYVPYLSEYKVDTENVLAQFITNDRTLVSYAGKNKDNIIVPYSIVSISDYAFADLGIKEIQISSSVEKIGYKAFSNNNLTKVTIPESVKSIGYEAFGNNNISQIIIEGKSSIPDSFDDTINVYEIIYH